MNHSRYLPMVPHFTEDIFQILLDIDSNVIPEYRELLKRYRLSHGSRDISILQSSTPTDVQGMSDAVREGELSWICLGWLLFLPVFVQAARRKDMTPIEYADWLYEQCAALNKEVGYRAAWIEAYGEVGTSIIWPKDKVFTKKEALEYYRKYLQSGSVLSNHWHKKVPPEVVGFYQHALSRDKDIRNLPIYYTEGVLFAMHEAFRAGFPFVVYEAACAARDAFQAGIAFVRGGAKTFDAFWGVDLSAWEFRFRGVRIHTSNSGGWDEGMTPDELFRIFLTSYMSGCNTYEHEVGYSFLYHCGVDSELSLSEYGFKAMQFFNIVKDVISDRGSPVVPFAIMLEEENGYHANAIRKYMNSGEIESVTDDSPNARLGVWYNCVGGATRGDWQIYRLISAIWPVPQNLHGHMFKHWPEEDFFKYMNEEVEATGCDVDTVKQKMNVGEIDPRDYAAFLWDSTWADCFDVIPEDASGKVLQQYYRAVILAGDIKTDNGLWDRISRFLAKGGQVVLCLEQLDSEAIRQLNLTVSDQPEKTDVDSFILCDGRELSAGENLSLYSLAVPKDTWVVWARETPTNKPLILRKQIKKGYLFVVLISNGMDSQAKRISSPFMALLDDLYDRKVGIRRSHGGCQMLVNRRKVDTLVTLLNHTSRDWRGTLTLDLDTIGHPVEEARNVLHDSAYPSGLINSEKQRFEVSVRVPAFEVQIVSFGSKSKRQGLRLGDRMNMSSEHRETVTKEHYQLLKEGPADILK